MTPRVMAGCAAADRPADDISTGASVDVLAARWGAAAAWGFTGLFVLSNATYMVLALTGPGQWRGVEDYLQTWTVLEFVPQMFGLVALPLLGFALTAAHRLTRPSRRVFGLAALAGGLAFVTVVWVGYFVQVAWLLSTVRAGAVTPGLELLVWQGMTGPGAHPMAPGAHGGHGAHHYHWWLLDAERGDFAAMGHLGQFLYVDPATNTVVVRQGHALGGVSSSAWLRLLRWTADHAAD